jgi:hypothetical protein
MKGVRLAGAVLPVAVLVGCGSGLPPVSADGPLAGAVSGEGECATARPGEGVTFGIETFQNAGHSILVLDSVALRDPRNLRLIGAFADPGEGDHLMGTLLWPPEPSPGFPLPSNWKDRKPVPGFRLAAGQEFNLVIGVEAPRRPVGSTSGLVIRYHDSAGRYVVEDHFAYMVVTLHACEAP